MSEELTMEKQPISAKKIIKICANVVFYLIIFFILLVSIANIRAGSKDDGMANIFGRGYLTVASNSMEGTQKDSFKKGDMIVVTGLTNDKARQEAANKLKLGDIVTFYDSTISATNGKKLNTHRVVFLLDSDNDGNVDQIFTMGDKQAELNFTDYNSNSFAEKYGESLRNKDASNAREINSWIENNWLQTFTSKELRGTYVKSIGGLGNAANTVQQWGLLIVVLPLCVFLAVEIYFFVKNLRAYRQARYADLHGDEIEAAKLAEKERLKAELRKELLEEMNNEKEFKDQKNNLENTSDAQDDSSEPKND